MYNSALNPTSSVAVACTVAWLVALPQITHCHSDSVKPLAAVTAAATKMADRRSAAQPDCISLRRCLILKRRRQPSMLCKENRADDIHDNTLQKQWHVRAKVRSASRPYDWHKQPPRVRHLKATTPAQ